MRGSAVLLLLGICSWSGPAQSDQAGQKPPFVAVAVVEDISGEVEFVQSGSAGGTRGAGSVLWAGTRVRVSANGHLVLGFVDGRRQRLEPMTVALVADEGLRVLEGTVEDLQPVAALTRLVPVLAAPAACATRIRQGAEAASDLGLRPTRDRLVIAGPLVLSFVPPPGYRLFAVRLVEGWDEELLAVETDHSEVAVPGGLLKPAATYQWSVESLDRDQPRLVEVAVFTTLTEEEAAARAALVERVETLGNASLAGLLDAVDQALCLDPRPSAAIPVSPP